MTKYALVVIGALRVNEIHQRAEVIEASSHLPRLTPYRLCLWYWLSSYSQISVVGKCFVLKF